MIIFFWSQDKKTVKIIKNIFKGLTLLLAIIAIFSLIHHQYIQRKNVRVTGTVVANDMTDITNTWTEFSYICNGEQYVARINRSFYIVGAEKELLCNPSSPTEISIYMERSVMFEVALVLAALIGFFWMLSFLQYRRILKNENT